MTAAAGNGTAVETVQTGCPACGAAVRIPAARLAEGPRCPRCKAALFGGTPAEVTSVNFDALVARSTLPVAVDFWAPWCGPCRTMAPAFAAAAGELEPRLRFAKLDTEAEPALAGRFGVRSIPTVIVFRAGRELARRSGAMDRGTLVRWLGSVVG